MALTPALYLIPVEISSAPTDTTIPAGNLCIVSELRHFIVENIRTARRFLRRWQPDFPIDDCTFHELNSHTPATEISAFLDPLRRGEAVGVMSEAGCPAVADPGSDVVAIAQAEGLRVVPLVGPSSILMSLMASGFNGQGFAFRGYLPIHDAERLAAIRSLESEAAKGMTQIFIETPYRNNKMLHTLAENLRPDTLLCVACDITDPEKEEIITLPAAKWRHRKCDFDKRPAIFLLHRTIIPHHSPNKRGR